MPLFRANTFASGQDQVVAPGNSAGPNAAPGVHGHDARGGAFHGGGQFIREIYKIACHDGSSMIRFDSAGIGRKTDSIKA